jgi:undecaprenyl-diphosphatase
MLVLFGELAWETIFRHAMGVFDNTIIWLVRYFATPGVDRMMIFISNLGYGLSYAVVVIAAFAGLAVYRRWPELEGFALSLAGGAVLNFVLKNIFERAPPGRIPGSCRGGLQFPRVHAMVSRAFTAWRPSCWRVSSRLGGGGICWGWLLQF